MKGNRSVSAALATTLLDAGRLEECLEELERVESDPGISIEIARIRCLALSRLGRWDELHEYLATLPIDESKPLSGLHRLFLARADFAQGGLEAALHRLAESEPTGDGRVDGAILQLKGACELRLGHLGSAADTLVAAIATFERVRSDKDVAECMNTLGICYRSRGAFDLAESCFRRAHASAAEGGVLAGVGMSSSNLGSLYLVLGRLCSAQSMYERASSFLSEAGARARVSSAQAALGVIHCRRGRFAEARECLHQAFRGVPSRLPSRRAAINLEFLAELHLAQGRFVRAARLLRRCVRMGEILCDTRVQYEAQYRLAEAELGQGNAELARSLAVEARDEFQERGDLLEGAFAARVAAQAAACLGHWDTAVGELEVLHRALAEVDEQFEIHRVARILAAARSRESVLDIRLAERAGRVTQRDALELDPTDDTRRVDSASRDRDVPSHSGASPVRRAPRTGVASRSTTLEEHELVFGRSQAFLECVAEVDHLASSMVPVLLEGETGAGKELLARRMHSLGPRATRSLVPFNCGTSSSALFDAELFGYVRGAFTGASSARLGLARMADKGTLLLDEIGELTPESQSRLLRFLDSGEVRPVGSDKLERSDVRVISATHKRLGELVTAGEFRQDLYFRIAANRIRVPALRERLEDLDLLIAYFIRVAERQHLGTLRGVSDTVVQKMSEYAWPGNARELRSHVFDLARKFDGRIATEWAPRRKISSRPAVGREISPDLFESALREANGSPTEAGQLLKVGRCAVYRLASKYGMDLNAFRN
ncbi:MAG: sigma 54-interacting transcriptional regulator [Candidatus Eisenbacteria bacterium]|uniref:Sigma 54-interacting transcriptional regulator n=1 Tax=Eiseniibacteriota bacterium TaxID=2212470 RepID=A0A956NFR4_UNCEI|nr:sigma 54-interacting transcriptional regulator [Candidatus Eisenbacteria bacterium]